MKLVILIRYGEIMLKGLNRPAFESRLIKNIKYSLREFGGMTISKGSGRMYVLPESEDYDFSSALANLKKVFGIVSLSIATSVDADFKSIKAIAINMANKISKEQSFTTFKVETTREDKSFPMNSNQINREIGSAILHNTPNLSAKMVNPQFKIYIEVRKCAYIYTEIVPAVGGMPVGTGGKALLLLSGGIDSPVAGWMMAKRGMTVDAVYFHSYPYTSERARDKVISLAKILASYSISVRLHIVPFTDIQLEINKLQNKRYVVIIMRRYMMRIAENIARSNHILALVTGENLGQVASQTLQSLVVTDAATNMLVFRPLIGFDKNEVIETARNIGTFDISTLPYQDCCTLFVPKHPETKPHLDKIIDAEKNLDTDELFKLCLANVEIMDIK